MFFRIQSSINEWRAVPSAFSASVEKRMRMMGIRYWRVTTVR